MPAPIALADAHGALRLKLYVLGAVLPLSASLPVFENLGFRVIAEDSYPVRSQSARAGRAKPPCSTS